MKYIAKPEFLKPRYFEIKEDLLVSFYLYIIEGDRCIYDQLQDTFAIAIEYAWEDYGVPKNAWKKKEVRNFSRISQFMTKR